MKKINVIYIGGSGRSGSTVLTKLLNFWEGFIGLNEACYLWRNGIHRNYPISNGELFSESGFWKEVLLRVFPGKMITKKQIDFFSYASLLGLKNLLKSSFRKRPTDPDISSYAKNLKNLYTAILEVSEAQFIVDSSKTPDYAHFLSGLDGMNIYFIHLVRDPRGVAYSWSKKFKRKDVQKGTEVPMTSFGLIESTLRWINWNIGCELIKRKKNVKYLRVRYEDFAQDPVQVLEKITDLLDLVKDCPKYYFTEEGFIDRHNAQDISIWGNPEVRKSQGGIKVRPDEKWVQEFSFKKKLIVTLLTFPFLIRYNYALFFTKTQQLHHSSAKA